MAIKTITTNLYMCDKCGHESSNGNDFMTSDLPSIVLSSDRDVVNTVWFKYGIMIAYAPNNYNPILCKKCMREVLLELVDKI
jgi:hypothetical protein